MQYIPVHSGSSRINPRQIHLQKMAVPSTLKNTLANAAEEEVAGAIVQLSQRCDGWVSWFARQQANTESGFRSLMAKNLLIEKQVEDGWTYELTDVAVEQIFVRQTEMLRIEAEIRRQEERKRSPRRRFLNWLYSLTSSMAR